MGCLVKKYKLIFKKKNPPVQVGFKIRLLYRHSVNRCEKNLTCTAVYVNKTFSRSSRTDKGFTGAFNGEVKAAAKNAADTVDDIIAKFLKEMNW